MFHATNKRFFTGLFFLLLAVFSVVPQSRAIEFQAIYMDEQGTGFYDETPLEETEKALIHADGNLANTLGEARRNAFEFVLDLFEIWLVGDNTVRVKVSFGDLEGGALAGAGPADYSSAMSDSGTEIWYPVALAENISGQELNGSTEADVEMNFNKNYNFYYGFSVERLALEELLKLEDFQQQFGLSSDDIHDTFILIAVHEMIHGLGFIDTVDPEDGSFHDELGGPTIYDVNLYSGSDQQLLINLSDEQRLDAITSGDLRWDGTNNGENSYSCAQLIGKVREVKERGGVDFSGRPRLYAPNPYESGSSVSHLDPTGEDDDIMNPRYAPLTYMDLTFGILRDIGWRLKRNAGDEYSPFNVKELLVSDSEVLEKCTVATAETAPPTAPAPSLESGGGGCSVTGNQGKLQPTIFNLFLVLSSMLLAFFSRNCFKPERKNLRSHEICISHGNLSFIDRD